MVPVNKSAGWVGRRSMNTNELHHPQAHEPTRHLYLSDIATLLSFLMATLQTFVHSHEVSPKT